MRFLILVFSIALNSYALNEEHRELIEKFKGDEKFCYDRSEGVHYLSYQGPITYHIERRVYNAIESQAKLVNMHLKSEAVKFVIYDYPVVCSKKNNRNCSDPQFNYTTRSINSCILQGFSYPIQNEEPHYYNLYKEHTITAKKFEYLYFLPPFLRGYKA